MGEWNQLPGDLVRTIEDFLVLYIDKVRFRSVCASWNSSNLQKLPNHQLKQLPWLLHTHDNNKDASHGFLNVIDSKTYQLDVPKAQGKMFKGSSHGWVATVEDSNYGPGIYLLNPLTSARIKLPPRNTFPNVKNYRPSKVDNEYGLIGLKGHGIYYVDSAHVNTYFLSKIVLSSTPSKKDCVVVAIYGVPSSLAYCKLNDKKWTLLHNRGSFADVIFYKGKLHALAEGGSLLVFESIRDIPQPGFISGSSRPASQGVTHPGIALAQARLTSEFSWDPKPVSLPKGGAMAPPGPLLPPPLIRANAEVKQIAYLASVVSCQLYLVESSDGELIMVKRHSRIQPREGYNESLYWPWKTYGFTVYKHDSSNLSWVELKDLGDGMLFLGYNSSLSFSCRDFGGDKSNRIYVTDDFNEFHWKGVKGGQDIGVLT
ncbi:hypothetical protein LguiA_012982 [Lonicera macranthoides]